MNLYLRYFNQETLVHNVDEALEFLNSIPDIHVDDDMKEDLIGYSENNVTYPKRYKIQPRVYFIVIKTSAETMEEFKANSKKNEQGPVQQVKNPNVVELCERRFGWYEASLLFKRVIPIPGTGKFQYRDTKFIARVKAQSPQECYNRIIKHLRNRQDVDLRSQFPSAKGKNYNYTYLGETLPKAE